MFYTILEPNPIDYPSDEDITLITITSQDELSNLDMIWKEFKDGDVLALDLETIGTKVWDGAKVVTIGLADSRGGLAVNIKDSIEGTLLYIIEGLTNANVPLIMHNAYFDASFCFDLLNRHLLRNPPFNFRKVRWPNIYRCTYATFRHLATEGEIGQTWGLQGAAETFLGWATGKDTEVYYNLLEKGYSKTGKVFERDPKNIKKVDKSKLGYADFEVLGKYCAIDALATYYFYTRVLQPAEQKFHAYPPYHKAVINWIKMTIVSTITGVYIDRTQLQDYIEVLTKNKELAEQKFLNHPAVNKGIIQFNNEVVGALLKQEPVRFNKKKDLKEPPKFTKKGHVSKSWQAWDIKKNEPPRESYHYKKWLEALTQVKSTNHFKWSSPKDLQWLFYTYLKFPVLVYTKNKDNPQPATDGSARLGFGEAGKLLDNLCDISKELEYVTVCNEQLDSSSLLHLQFKLPGTVTGRASGSGGLNCFPEYVEILTEQGWVSCCEITYNLKVAAVDIHSKNLSFEYPENITRYLYDGKLYSFQYNRGGLDVTNNHRMCWFGGKNQNFKHVITLPADQKPKQTRLYIGHTAIDTTYQNTFTEEEIWKAAAIQADGHKRTNHKDVYVIEVKKERKVIKLRELFGEESGCYNGVYTWSYIKFESKLLTEQKTWNLQQADSTQASLFLSAISFWDSTFKSRTKGLNIEYSSKIESNVDEVQAYFARSGFNTVKKLYSNCYRLYITDNNYSDCNFNSHVSHFPYKGRVGCVTVSTGYIMVRSNGRVFITGNCQQLPKTRGYLSCWKARQGYKILAFDFTALEPVVLTALSRDASMNKLYGNNAPKNDIYLFVGANLNLPLSQKIRDAGYDPDNPTPEGIKNAKKVCKTERDICKVTVLQIGYSAGAKKIRQSLSLQGVDISMEQATSIFNSYWTVFEGVKQYIDYLKAQWDKNGGWVLNGAGRPIGSCERKLKDLLNSVVQSTGHDLLILHLDIVKDLIPMDIDYYIYLSDWHDAFYLEVKDEDVERVVQILDKVAIDVLNAMVESEVSLTGKTNVVDNLADDKVE